MSTTPRTDAAWNATFDGEQISAGKTARALRECSQQLETELTTLTAERDQLRAEVKSCGELSCDECNARTAALITERDQLRADNSTLRAAQKACEACDEPTAFEVQQLRAALALGQQNCDDAYDDLRTERDAAIARAERAEAELAAERARLDYLSTRGYEHRHHRNGDHLAFQWTISSTNELKDVSLREVIDAAMQEDAK